MNLSTMNDRAAVPELAAVDDAAFSTLQAQLAAQGIELHRVTGATGREAFTVNLRGQVRTLDTLLQVAAYARRLGGDGRGTGLAGVTC